ncbi:MAG: paraquat-inducible membrane protein A [Epsilonproteobacteria bacterium]|nr:paraquat-inducible membrane protein A [Campylobacterota bacterium]NPA57406.1 paraquat-inducible membrane protein A [Campylobacterota bacterium]
MTKWIRCRHCGAANRAPRTICRRCGLDIEIDPKGSLFKATLLLCAAIIFYIPANLYPVLQSASFGSVKGSTILEGVVELWKMGDYPVAIIIFVASILVPLLKFAILAYLILSIFLGRCHKIEEKVRLYYLIEITGPWSLIDIFVVLVLAALVHFNSISIIAGPGATSFGIMVFLTIIAAHAVDERILGVTCE